MFSIVESEWSIELAQEIINQDHECYSCSLNLKGLDCFEKMQHNDECLKKYKQCQIISHNIDTTKESASFKLSVCDKCGEKIDTRKSIDILKHKKKCIKQENNFN